MTAIGARVLVFVLLTLLVGCDDVYGPTLQNAFGYSVELAVTYSDGSVQIASWPVCRTVHVGAANREVVKASIADGDRRIELSVARIRELLKVEASADVQVVWRISEKGIVRVDARRSAPCEATGNEQSDR